MRRRVAALACVAATVTGLVSTQPALRAETAAATSALVPLAPCRLFDSRHDGGATVPANHTTTITTAGRCGVPDGAIALVLSVTITSPARAGFISVWPSGSPRPNTSVVNVEVGETRTNGAIVATGADGSVSASASTSAHLVVDVTGAFVHTESARAGRFVAMSPTRLLDTRTSGARPAAGTTVRVPLPAGVPSDATALALTIATSDTSGAGYFSAYGAATPRPESSLLNSDGGRQVRAAGQIVAAGPEGIDVYSQRGEHLIIDVTGWFTGASAPPSNDGLFVAAAPTRLLDTRSDREAGGIFPGGTITFDPSAFAGGPVAAIAANWTMTDTRAGGYLSAYPARSTRPVAATVNSDRRRQSVAQFGIVASSNLGVAMFSSSGTEVVIDATGWFTGSPIAATETSDPPNTPRPDTARRVLLVGDSTLAGVRWYGSARHALAGSDFVLDAESCRRLVGTSCSGREGRRPPNAVQTIAATEGVLDTVVIMTGYNDWHASFRTAVDQVIAAARSKGATRVIWLTYREGTAYQNPTGGTPQDEGFRIQNQILRDVVAIGLVPELVIADYDAYTRGTNGWFTSDGVHFTIAGAYGTADYLSRSVASLYGEPCAAPWSAGGMLDSPCPSPDGHAPVADPVGLHAGNAADVHCYEIGVWRQLACRVDPKLHLS